jgi:glycosyltransferase involved in cell wall biosynthesis
VDAVKIHTVFVTHNRLDLTKQALFSYLETVSVPHSYCVVDNASTDETPRWLLNTIDDVHLLKENRYPGYATNLGWSHAPADATHFHRADNDYGFLPGWCEEVAKRFRAVQLGQLGLRTDIQEPGADSNVGGNCVIRRELWDAGLRYDETPWPEMPPGITEDSFFSPHVEKMGWNWARVRKQCIYELEEVYADTNTDPYYEKSWGDRHIHGRTPQ